MMWTTPSAIAVGAAAAAAGGSAGHFLTMDAGLDFETLSSARRGADVPFESASSRDRSSRFAVESALAVQRFDRSLGEFARALRNDISVVGEGALTLRLGSKSAAELMASASSHVVVTLEFIGGIGIIVDGQVLIENLSSPRSDMPVVGEIVAKLSSDSTTEVEGQHRIAADARPSGEWSLRLIQPGDAPIEWLGSSAIFLTADEVLAIECVASAPPALISLANGLRSPGRVRLLASPGRARLRGGH